MPIPRPAPTALALAIYPLLVAGAVLSIYLSPPIMVQSQLPRIDPAALPEQCLTRTAQCLCESREMIRRIPCATLDALLAQPPSNARVTALFNTLMATALRDRVAITRLCGPVLHPETAPEL